MKLHILRPTSRQRQLGLNDLYVGCFPSDLSDAIVLQMAYFWSWFGTTGDIRLT